MTSDAQASACINVLGVGVSAINLSQAVTLVDEALRARRKGYICVTGVHGVMEAQRDPELKSIHNRSFLTTPDGMPMVWLGRLHGARHMSRVYGPDLMRDVLQMSPARGYKHFFYGGADGVAEELGRVAVRRFPGLQVVGTYQPPFRPLQQSEAAALREQISECRPDMMWIGISTPKQERFMAEYLPQLDVTLMAGVGAAFNFHAGRVSQAPFWVQRSGFEWLYRCIREPRLWKRYGVIIPSFLFRVGIQFCGLKKYAINGATDLSRARHA